MTIKVGERYQHLIGRGGCTCIPQDAGMFPDSAIADLSRRRFLATIATGAVSAAAVTSTASAASAPASVSAILPAAIIAKVHAAIDADTPRLLDIFKDLHQHPELAFTELRTSGIVARDLHDLGFEVTEGIGKTGVVGVMRNGTGPTAWLRADMDCNQVRETTGLPWAATQPQRLADGTEVDVMHACGHDAHVTWMLGSARALAGLKADWAGTLVVYAQPAEEIGLGAQAMVEDGLWRRGFPRPDYAFGAHTAPGPVGFVANSPGVRMAGTDQLDITFTGLGGHGSTPEMTIDPVVMAAQAVLNYQTIISRSIDPQSAAVLSVGAIEAGTSNNIIPGSATLKLNLRWFSAEVRDKMIRRIDEVGRGVAIGAGVEEAHMPTRHMKGNAGPLVNDEALVGRVNPSLAALLGPEKVIDDFPAVMGSEDFQEAFRPLGGVPYSFALIGVAPVEMFLNARAAGRPFPYSNHNSDFFVDLAAIPIGAKVNTVAVLSVLAKSV
jgi:hippurate hydrolase